MPSIRTRIFRPIFAATLLVLTVTLLALACSGGDGDTTPDAGDAHTDGDGNFNVSMNDDGAAGNNRFEPNEFTVSAGQQVTFNLTNDGTLPHNMRVDGGDGSYFTDDDTVSDSEVIQPAETSTLTWTAPDQPGTFIFQCDLHPVDMTGTITVE